MDAQENSTVTQPAPPGTMLLIFWLNNGALETELVTVISFVLEPAGRGGWGLMDVVTTVQGEELYPDANPFIVVEHGGDAFTRRALVIGGRVSYLDHEYDSVEDFLTSMRKWKGFADHMLPRSIPHADRAKWIEKHDFPALS